MRNYVNNVPSWKLFSASNNFIYRKGGFFKGPLLFGKLKNKEIVVVLGATLIVNFGLCSIFYLKSPSIFDSNFLLENKDMDKLRAYLSTEQYCKWISLLGKYNFRMKIVRRCPLLKRKYDKYLCLSILGVMEEEEELSEILHLLVSL